MTPNGHYRLFVSADRLTFVRLWADGKRCEVSRRESPQDRWGLPVRCNMEQLAPAPAHREYQNQYHGD